MCLIIATTFTVTWLPYQLDRLVLVYGNTADALVALDALETIAYLNSCVNPIVYALMWRPFRQAFTQVMRTCYDDWFQVDCFPSRS